MYFAASILLHFTQQSTEIIPPGEGYILLEDGSGALLLEDGQGFLLEGNSEII